MTMSTWHSMDADAVAAELSTGLQKGLTSAESERRLQSHGPNRLPEAIGVTWSWCARCDRAPGSRLTPVQL